MKLKIQISLDNAAFIDAGIPQEAGRIIEEYGRKVREIDLLPNSITLHDVNGNKVGFAETIDD